MARKSGGWRWQAMTDEERHAFVAESNRAECEAQGIPRYVTDPVHLEPVVRAVLEVEAAKRG